LRGQVTAESTFLMAASIGDKKLYLSKCKDGCGEVLFAGTHSFLEMIPCYNISNTEQKRITIL
jgi:hypothetical protein